MKKLFLALTVSLPLLAIPPLPPPGPNSGIPTLPPPGRRPQPITPGQPFPEKLKYQFCYGEKAQVDVRKKTVKLVLLSPGVYGSETFGEFVETFWQQGFDIPSAISTGIELTGGYGLNGGYRLDSRSAKSFALDWNRTLTALSLQFPDDKATHGTLSFTVNGEAETFDVDCQRTEFLPRD